MNKSDIEVKAKLLEETLSTIKRHGLTFKNQQGLKNSERHILWMLNTLTKESTNVKASDIAKKLNITYGAVTHQINSLVKMGFVQRVNNPKDRRESWLEFTSKGQEMISTIKENYWNKLCKLVEYLGKEDTDRLTEIIVKMGDFFKNDENN